MPRRRAISLVPTRFVGYVGVDDLLGLLAAVQDCNDEFLRVDGGPHNGYVGGDE
jgi:hypothetical protein